ncbi:MULTISPECIES: metallopeptidase TldD-related protein [unclassified Anaerobiospirillum]|uniref:metallopeptidase TldD-related protein n=1 Tax=unclassified Anaerobiospirillum TaxID=2647410 RepID=UPI001FF17B20|nr:MULTISPECIES: metallopeptidase TldD-related protein [unclassified Anaerobiospirillum]MCK0525439.1 metallopeptidase TldD-related protein [Anaerobiospirillum sp. NML120449]MCK0534146.1 metallopeptidase TldD-related protein [Anaerobiospirillum sp. NML120511]MCK0539310.1 metallopeptidase TldD-related protein [Anaerobiospirillum sp. NML02-A-032]
MSYFAQLKQHQQRYEELAVKAVEMARARGADEVRIKISAGKGLDISSRHCEIENIEFNQMQGMGVSVFKDKHAGSATTSDFSEESISAAVDSALNLCEYTSRDECSGLCEDSDLYKGDMDLEMLYELEEEPDEIARRAVNLDKMGADSAERLREKGLKESDGSSWGMIYTLRTLATSQGFCRSSIDSDFSKYLSLVGERDGVMQRSAGYYSGINPALEWSDEKVLDEAVTRTLNKLGARKVKTGRYTVILSESAANSLISNFISAASGMLIYQNSSFLKDMLNERIFPEFLSIYEDPWIKGGIASAAFDSEGVATRPLNIVTDGVLREYFIDSYSARKLKMACNGHNDPCYNLFINADDAHTCSLEEMMKQAGSGLVINTLMGQGVNMVNGNLSRGASGFYFENGERVHAVDEITIAGNLKDIFASIAMIGTDRDERRRIQTGSIMLPEITVSGI